jgi:hypothetical protein
MLRINQYIPYIAANPANMASMSDAVGVNPERSAAIPARPKNAAAVTSVRNDSTPNSQLLSGCSCASAAVATLV